MIDYHRFDILLPITLTSAGGIALWLTVVIFRLTKNLFRKYFPKGKTNKKSMETVTISLSQLQQLTEGALTSEEAVEAIIAWANITNKRKLDMNFKREYNVYEDDNFSVYQLLPNEFAVYFKDLDRSLIFSLEAGKEVIMQDGIEYDTIEDLKINLDGQTIMSFDGRYI